MYVPSRYFDGQKAKKSGRQLAREDIQRHVSQAHQLFALSRANTRVEASLNAISSKFHPDFVCTSAMLADTRGSMYRTVNLQKSTYGYSKRRKSTTAPDIDNYPRHIYYCITYNTIGVYKYVLRDSTSSIVA